MKKLVPALASILLTFALPGAASAAEGAFPQVGATYEITTPLQPGTVNRIEVLSASHYRFVEVNGDSEMSCDGQYGATGGLLIGHLTCDNGTVYTQVLDLGDAADQVCTGAEASARSSLFGLEMAYPVTVRATSCAD
jgi:hypothetical protein